jgi:hypothetical protein
MKFVTVLNALNTPWLAIIVICLGMIYAIVSHAYGISGDGASGVIGAGIGLLTGQALSKQQLTQEPMTPAEPPVAGK